MALNSAMLSSVVMLCAAAPNKQAAVASKPASEAAPLTLNVGGGTSIRLPIARSDAESMAEALEGLICTFTEKSKAEKSGGAAPRRWSKLDYRHDGGKHGGVTLELYCNPNGFTDAFHAKLLLTIADDKLRCTAEAPLTSVKADVDNYLG